MSSRLLRFLGSMPLAVTLLSAVAIASVIGTLLQQNQPYQDYLIKFGPFWHQVYLSLGLYDVYSSLWFLLLLAFLVASTSVCLLLNGPAIVASASDYREHLHSKILAHMPEHQQWRVFAPLSLVQGQLQQLLQQYGYRLRSRADGERVLIAAKKGSANRFGYICAHLAVVVICIGGLLDGNIPMKWQSLFGSLAIETRDLPASQVPAASRLDTDNSAFRANISIPEGSAADFAFINVGRGYVLQELPFQIRLKDFRIEHYSTGQPKSFQSDLVLRDPERDTTLEKTISVNEPLRYRGFNIYQASFEDGGSKLDLTLRPLIEPAANPEALDVSVRVNDSVKVTAPDSSELKLEIEDFRAYNINRTAASVERGQDFRDDGPSFQFKLRRVDGSAREYRNYMRPVTLEGRDYLLSGTRGSQAEPFRYLYIPVDAAGSADTFFEMLHLLHDDDRLAQVIRDRAGQRPSEDERELTQQLTGATLTILKLFRDGGYGAIAEHMDTSVPEDQRQFASEAYIKLLHGGLRSLYLEVLDQSADSGLSESQSLFLDDAISALAGVPNYGAPFYIALNDYEQRQASGLLIARSPGKLLVYPGFALLLAGIFLLFYIAQRRVWIELREADDGRVQVDIAGESNRLQDEFRQEFEQLASQARQAPEQASR
ncbi:cytochrome c biogenesis protein [Methylohalomonas lacus]|uniref:Cytochrome c biogenesis protein n=1 Tax=Methylohalomonas lacus TaxID=398773 RepID=A0AAE3L4P0_9GAMM|nr:cytochrome c biogenesis protein ResB [Methylohalomonas lacus]MCS3902052.1 cytochrome c biogenesis protein [Methylohalomonas lacus]